MTKVNIKEIVRVLLADNLTIEQRDIILDLVDEVLESREALSKSTDDSVSTEPPEIPRYPHPWSPYSYPWGPSWPTSPDEDPNKNGITWSSDANVSAWR